MTEAKRQPHLNPIYNGWAAYGDGWAVHGRTKEEALALFHTAERKHQEIMARPVPTSEPEEDVASALLRASQEESR